MAFLPQGNLRVRSVQAVLPNENQFRQYEVFSPETQELYVFNRHGQHVATKNIITGMRHVIRLVWHGVREGVVRQLQAARPAGGRPQGLEW
jgi:hypothetical protein